MSARHQDISHLLLDIEGTTCPVSFVAEVLFPYASSHLETYLRAHAEDAAIRALAGEVMALWQADRDPAAQELLSSARQGPMARDPSSGPQLKEALAVVPYLQLLIRADRKVTPLKELQGMIWEEGYARGELIGPLFEDVAPALRRWTQQGIVLAVYSSGSIQAQQLLYGHSSAGDLRPLFRHWFDTRSGLKQEPASYSTIAASMAADPGRTLFISDALAELQAARTAGLQVLFSRREGNPQQQCGSFATISRFSELILES